MMGTTIGVADPFEIAYPRELIIYAIKPLLVTLVLSGRSYISDEMKTMKNIM